MRSLQLKLPNGIYFWGLQMKQMIMKRARLTSTTCSKQSRSLKENSSEQAQGDNLRGNIRTNIQSSMEKYTTLAHEAMMTGDRVLAESFYQQAEHYLRLSNEFKENILVLPKSETIVSSSQDHITPANDFEMSIEQELEMAQANI